MFIICSEANTKYYEGKYTKIKDIALFVLDDHVVTNNILK